MLRPLGHVDHGKSTLMGRLLYELKVIDQATMDRFHRDAKKIGKSSFAFAWVMDATTDERNRGITVNTATSFFETEKTKFTILDAPGHQDFVPNMISGASQADFAVLVIDAGPNSFESGLRGQTKEHAWLVRSMGVQRIVVAVNKMDKAGWLQDRFREITLQMTSFLTSVNFAPKNIAFVPCAGLTGENLVTRLDSKTAPWYSGPTLLDELENFDPSSRMLDHPFRLTIAEIYKSSPTAAVSISGRIDAGTVQKGDALAIIPHANASATVRSLDADNEPSAEWAVAGQIATLHLAHMDAETIPALRPGDIVCHAHSALKPVRSFTGKFLAFDHLMPMFVDVLRGPLKVPGRIVNLVATLDKGSGAIAKKKPRVVLPGGMVRLVVAVEGAEAERVGLPVEKGSRVVLRAEGKSIAAGLVE